MFLVSEEEQPDKARSDKAPITAHLHPFFRTFIPSHFKYSKRSTFLLKHSTKALSFQFVIPCFQKKLKT
ncbi:hypothetical protein B4168_2363 [Anoxybacillus flavithermus]|nr:hypothetical protein B4168_2363 [Anoxybacillus flavithermus]OAO87788.1 hypothetical protein GT23_0935 [Parageobacillus thermoglucosidasius]